MEGYFRRCCSGVARVTLIAWASCRRAKKVVGPLRPSSYFSAGWPALYASVLYGGVFGLLSMGAALSVAVSATVVTWITVLMLLAFAWKPRGTLPRLPAAKNLAAAPSKPCSPFSSRPFHLVSRVFSPSSRINRRLPLPSASPAAASSAPSPLSPPARKLDSRKTAAAAIENQQHGSASVQRRTVIRLTCWRLQQRESRARFIPSRAFFLCTSIDLRSLQAQNAFNVIPPNSRATNYVVLRYYDVKGDQQGLEVGLINESHCHYMVVFQYGSIVLFNVSDHEADGYLKIVEKHASGLLTEMRKDDYAVVEKPTLDSWMQGGLDYIMLKTLSIDGIRTIGSVLGQSIALDYYIRQVDGMVAEFTDINRGMEKTGTFTMKRKKLFQLVGKANSNLADVILKLGLFERSDIAWKNANYAQIWEYLRDEYELTQRFGSLDFKLKFVEHNIRFLQEILQNRKSDFLEWLIIILISVEILISVFNIVRESSITSL
ncbi:uncharacterized protein A4U43_C07F3730 [Asparagus officinalis]|uniref:DUF155 domain-containing protein n=1 Tax=Asparagus officinalis TaxID=4686 RepID=A0A5P1E955_ASPOF|nr:uncharacterized protein LOC109846662 [Asparagus officinalis]ONK62425.1 uncharacterized protein A4U43_C07F3730 [Asparagus officinalis]